MEWRPHYRSRPCSGCAFYESPIPRSEGSLSRHGTDDPCGPGSSQRAGDGRRFTAAMKILVVGLDCAAPELLFGDERLANFRRLMENGCYGKLESVIPP